MHALSGVQVLDVGFGLDLDHRACASQSMGRYAVLEMAQHGRPQGRGPAVGLPPPDHKPDRLITGCLQDGRHDGQWVPCIVKVNARRLSVASHVTQHTPPPPTFVQGLQSGACFWQTVLVQGDRCGAPAKDRAKAHSGHQWRDAQQLADEQQVFRASEGRHHRHGEAKEHADHESCLNPRDESDAPDIGLVHG